MFNVLGKKQAMKTKAKKLTLFQSIKKMSVRERKSRLHRLNTMIDMLTRISDTIRNIVDSVNGIKELLKYRIGNQDLPTVEANLGQTVQHGFEAYKCIHKKYIELKRERDFIIRSFK